MGSSWVFWRDASLATVALSRFGEGGVWLQPAYRTPAWIGGVHGWLTGVRCNLTSIASTRLKPAVSYQSVIGDSPALTGLVDSDASLQGWVCRLSLELGRCCLLGAGRVFYNIFCHLITLALEEHISRNITLSETDEPTARCPSQVPTLK